MAECGSFLYSLPGQNPDIAARMATSELQWHKVAERYQLENQFMKAGQLATVTIDGNRYCLGRLEDGYFAIEDKCPHAGASLSRGTCTSTGQVVCPLHRFTFDLKTGKNTSGEGLDIRSYPLEERPDGLWIAVPPKQSLWKLLFGK